MIFISKAYEIYYTKLILAKVIVFFISVKYNFALQVICILHVDINRRMVDIDRTRTINQY